MFSHSLFPFYFFFMRKFYSTGDSLNRSCTSGHLRILKSAMSAVNVLEPLWDRDDRGLEWKSYPGRNEVHSDSVRNNCESLERLNEECGIIMKEKPIKKIFKNIKEFNKNINFLY